jgi:hypothetical protein
MEGSCEHGNEPSGSIKCWELLEWLHIGSFSKGLSCMSEHEKTAKRSVLKSGPHRDLNLVLAGCRYSELALQVGISRLIGAHILNTTYS